MPYIKQKDRTRIEDGTSIIVPKNAGELNFILTSIIQYYFLHRGGRYQQINDVIGALEGAKLEFYRRVVAPYEDEKIKENGDVLFEQVPERGTR